MREECSSGFYMKGSDINVECLVTFLGESLDASLDLIYR